MPEVEFGNHGIHFHNYPYPPASVYPSGTIAYGQILEVDPFARQIRTKNRDILFVARNSCDELQSVAAAHNIPIVRCIEVWDLILEPFLDTEFDDDHKNRTLETLEDCGLSRSEVEILRLSLQNCMYKYNIESGLWDWCSLGLTDVLDMRLGKLAGSSCRLPPDEYREFYFYAMEIAFRGKPF